jgi:hypothetical protein
VSENGRIVCDIMLDLAKTCAKLKISFFDYLGARLDIPATRNPVVASHDRSRSNRIASPGSLPRSRRICKMGL